MVVAACTPPQPDASRGEPGPDASSSGEPQPDASSGEMATDDAKAGEGPTRPGEPTAALKIPPELGGSFGDIAEGRVVWASEPRKPGFSRAGVWMARLPNGKPQLLARAAERSLVAAVDAAPPFVSWIEYRENAQFSGPWAIHVFDLRTQESAIVASWRDTGLPAAQQSIPFVRMNNGVLVWQDRAKNASDRATFCIRRYDIVRAAGKPVFCTESSDSYPHFASVRDGVVSYIVNTRQSTETGAAISEPRSPQYPELATLFQRKGALQGWQLMTREVVADRKGVAWIAETPGVQGGGRIFYWEPGERVVSLRTKFDDFPASKVDFVGGAIVWEEPDRANNIFGADRKVFGCAPAVVPLLPRSMVRGRTSVRLLGVSPEQVLIGIRRFTSDPLPRQDMVIISASSFPMPTEC